MGKDKSSNKSFFDFFKYFKKMVGIHIYGYIFFSLLVGLLDGLGLTLFIPLLGLASGTEEQIGGENLGKLQYFLDAFDFLDIDFNLSNALIFIIILFCLKSFLSYANGLYFSKIRLRSIRNLRFRIIQRLETLSYFGFTALDVGKIQNTMIGELTKLINALQNYFSTIQHSIMLFAYISLAFLSNWQFALLVALGGASSNFFYKFLNDYTKKKSREISQKGHNFNNILIQVLNNFKYLKATNYITTYSKKLRNNIWEQEDMTFRMGKINSIAGSAREPFIIIIISIVIIIQIKYFDSPFSSILVSILLFYRGLGHLISLQGVWNNFLGSSAGLDSFDNLMNELEQYTEPQNNKESIDKIDDIEIKNINHSYGEMPVIKNVNFTIKKNTSVAFVGESGAGKTTLANIISGLLSPDNGEVMIGHQSLYKSNLNSFRKHIGYITQEPVIFDDTIFNNISFWQEKNEQNKAKFDKVINNVALSDFLERLPQKEDSPLGNNGVLVSGGQKQRISIARELYKDIDLLILDEATSALDSETERHIKNSIDLLQGQTTIIIIAHRLSTIKDVDVIYLMDKGEIIASGSFDELVQKSERFKKMVELQEV